MDVKTTLITGREQVNRAMRATMGKFGPRNSLSDKTFLSLLKARHSPIQEYVLWFDITAPERVHTHIARHKECGLYVATSRPDISYGKPITNGYRQFSWRINAKRLIEIMQVRLCSRAWEETVVLMNIMRDQVCEIDPIFKEVLHPSCVWCGFCPEAREGNPSCGYDRSAQCSQYRKNLIKV